MTLLTFLVGLVVLVAPGFAQGGARVTFGRHSWVFDGSDADGCAYMVHDLMSSLADLPGALGQDVVDHLRIVHQFVEPATSMAECLFEHLDELTLGVDLT